MSQYEQQDNEGELFNNKQRTEENNRPHYTGKCRVDGVDKQMSAYINVAGENAKNPGEKYLKIRFQEPWVSRKTENTEKPKKAGSIQPLSSSLEEMVVVTVDGETPEKPEKNPFLEEQDIPF